MSQQAPPDRLPPRRPDAELGICGCAILDPDRIPDLRKAWFDTAPGQKLFDVLRSFAEKPGVPVDYATVAERLMAEGVQDAATLVNSAIDQAPTKFNFRYWQEILDDQATRRMMIEKAEEAIASAHDVQTPATEALDRTESEFLQIRKELGTETEECDKPAIMDELVDDWEAAMNGTRPRGITTGFSDLDRLTGGLKPGQVFVLAARPSVGKTALALNIAEDVAVKRGLPVGFWTLEMTAKELLQRLTCSLAEVDSADLDAGRIAQEQFDSLTRTQIAVRKAPLHIVDRGGMTIGQLAASGRRMLHKHKIKLAVVDYLGLLRCGEKRPNRYEETTLISNALKSMAKELGIPVLALAQLNRDAERQDRPPQLGDLRDSGSIEQDADLVALLHRPKNAAGDFYEVTLTLAKCRNGRVGEVNLVFQAPYCRFRLGTQSNGQRQTTR